MAQDQQTRYCFINHFFFLGVCVLTFFFPQGGIIPGIGNYTRSSTELCLVAVRGNVMRWKKDFKVRQAILARRREHSRKPEESYERIESFFNDDIRKLEVFSRQRRPGWHVLGNELDKFEN